MDPAGPPLTQKSDSEPITKLSTSTLNTIQSPDTNNILSLRRKMVCPQFNPNKTKKCSNDNRVTHLASIYNWSDVDTTTEFMTPEGRYEAAKSTVVAEERVFVVRCCLIHITRMARNRSSYMQNMVNIVEIAPESSAN